MLAELAQAETLALVRSWECSLLPDRAPPADAAARRAEASRLAALLPPLAAGEPLASVREKRLAYATGTLGLPPEAAEAAVAFRAIKDELIPARGYLFPGKISSQSPPKAGRAGGQDQLDVIMETLAGLERGTAADPMGGWRARFPAAHPEMIAIMRLLLQLQPAARCTVRQAMENAWFNDKRVPGDAEDLARARERGGAAARVWEAGTLAADDASIRALLMELIRNQDA